MSYLASQIGINISLLRSWSHIRPPVYKHSIPTGLRCVLSSLVSKQETNRE